MFSEYELFLLMSILLIFPKKEWTNYIPVKEGLHQIIELLTLENCLEHPALGFALLKFQIKTISEIFSVFSKKVIKKFVKNLHYISLFYGLSFEKNLNISFTLLHKGIKSMTKINRHAQSFLDKIDKQSLNTRIFFRKKTSRIIKILADQNLKRILGVFNDLLDHSEFTILTHLNVLDLLRYLIRFDDKKLKMDLNLFIHIVIKALDPHKPEIRSKC